LQGQEPVDSIKYGLRGFYSKGELDSKLRLGNVPYGGQVAFPPLEWMSP
jgi:hypothetical protein